jgi:hypothetical protein
MKYLLVVTFAIAGIVILIWNKSLSQKFGAFYAQRFSLQFGTLAHFLGWDNPSKRFNKFMYRGFVITAAIILLIFAFAAFTGTNFVGPSTKATQPSNSLLQVQQ